MRRELSRENLTRLIESESLESLSFEQLVTLFEKEEGVANYIPDGTFQVDPRNSDIVVFNSSRAKRPHDNRQGESLEIDKQYERECVICNGRTTGIVDLADLSEGFTFINKNLFPVVFPSKISGAFPDVNSGVAIPSAGKPVHGFHFLQWTSSLHERDWHNMPVDDGVIVMRRLAVLEEWLLNGSRDYGSKALNDDGGGNGYVSIIKNFGHLVGGSLIHGHQQIVYSNVMPKRFRDNWHFQQKRSMTFSKYMLKENPPALVVKDYGPAILLVPYFMRRPFDMLLIVKDTSKRYLYELTENEITAVTLGWQDAIRVMLHVIPMIGKVVAYNILTDNGPGAGLYFEFLPYTQEIGGLENLGMIICQGNPYDSAKRIRNILGSQSVDE